MADSKQKLVKIGADVVAFPAGMDDAKILDAARKHHKKSAAQPSTAALDPRLQAVGKEYPRLAPFLSNVQITQGTKASPTDDRGLEFYSPWESENPNKGKITLQLFDKLEGPTLTRALGGDLLHYLGALNPTTGKPIDPTYYSLKQAVLKARTPQQDATDRREYASAVKNQGEKRPYDKWLQESRLDAYIRGYVTPELGGRYPDEWRKQGHYKSPDMLKAVEAIRSYVGAKPMPPPEDSQARLREILTPGKITPVIPTGLTTEQSEHQRQLVPARPLSTAIPRLPAWANIPIDEHIKKFQEAHLSLYGPELQREKQEQQTIEAFRKAHPNIGAVERGVSQFAEGMKTPANLALMLGAPESKLLSAFFSVQAMRGSFKDAQAAKKAFDEGKNTEAIQYLTQSVLGAGIGALAGAHAYGGLPENVRTALASEEGALKITPEFMRELHESKIKDEAGNPLMVYHGTRSSRDFDVFSTEGPVQETEGGEYVSSGSGADPTAYLGAHFAKEPRIANKFAQGSEQWMKSRYEEGQEKPRVIPAFLSIKNPKDFGSEYNLRDYIYQGKPTGYAADELVNEAMRADGLEPEEEDDPKVEGWLKKYDEDPEFRAKQNKYILEDMSQGEDDSLHREFAQDLASSAKSRLKSEGHDGAIYKNVVEGGTSFIAFEPEQVHFAFSKSGAFAPETGQPKTERRADPELRRRISEMSPDEMRKMLLTSEVVDLPNKRSFQEDQHFSPASFVARSDADGLKAFNDKFGYEKGDELLRAKAEALKEAGLNAYHEKGDEFLYRGNNEKDIQERLEKARQIMRDRVFAVTLDDGTTVYLKGADFSYGVGKDLKEAEQRQHAHKAEREQAGLRKRGELGSITEVGPEAGGQREGVAPSPAAPPLAEVKKKAAELKPTTAYRTVDDTRPFYLKTENLIADKMKGPMPAEDVHRMLLSNGVKPDEMQWTGLDEFLKEKGKTKVTPQEVQNYLAANSLQLQEVVKGEPRRVFPKDFASKSELRAAIEDDDRYVSSDGQLRPGLGLQQTEGGWNLFDRRGQEEGGATRYGSYVLPGGENYREMLITMPNVEGLKFDPSKLEIKRERRSTTQGSTSLYYDGKLLANYGDDPTLQPDGSYRQKSDAYWQEMAKQIFERGDPRNSIQAQGGGFRSGHWDEPNIIGHVRFNDRVGPNGEKILHLEELQSDWHHKGRKQGYGGTPEMKGLEQELAHAKLTFEKADKDATHAENELLAAELSTPKDNEATRARRDYLNGLFEKYGENNVGPENLTGEEFNKMVALNRAVNAATEKANTELKEQARFFKAARATAQERLRRVEARLVYLKQQSIPEAPFKKTWPELLLKRMIKYAVDHGYDGISWTPGEEQAARYDLSKQLSEVRALKQGDTGQYTIEGFDHQGNHHDLGTYPKDKLADAVGKDLAEKIVRGEGERNPKIYQGNAQIFSGVDLKVGGEGMKGFYDKILPDAANKLAKAWGGKVEKTKIGVSEVPSELVIQEDDGIFGVYDREAMEAMEPPLAEFDTREEAERYAQEAQPHSVKSSKETIAGDARLGTMPLYASFDEVGNLLGVAGDRDVLPGNPVKVADESGRILEKNIPIRRTSKAMPYLPLHTKAKAQIKSVPFSLFGVAGAALGLQAIKQKADELQNAFRKAGLTP